MKKVNKTVDKRQKDIQKKLSAAILMLLVSSIMMVSSTYAWFTLSTAPEVKGIQATIGGNGNLEIALGYSEYDEDGTDKVFTFNYVTAAEVDTQIKAITNGISSKVTVRQAWKTTK